MKCAVVPVWGEKGDRPVAYVGPSQNLKPEERRHPTPIDRQKSLETTRFAMQLLRRANTTDCTLTPTATLTIS